MFQISARPTRLTTLALLSLLLLAFGLVGCGGGTAPEEPAAEAEPAEAWPRSCPVTRR